MERLLVIAVFPFLTLLGSCAPWSSHLATHSYLGIHLVGSLTKDDVQQISALARHRPDIRKPIYKIYITSPGKADVTGGKAENTGDLVTPFKVRKDNGRWKIIEGSVYQTEVLITS